MYVAKVRLENMCIVKTHKVSLSLLQNPSNQGCSNPTITPNFEHINHDAAYKQRDDRLIPE